MGGWIKLHRDLANHWLFQDKPFSKGQAWIDLLLTANYKPSKVLIGESVETVGVGEILISENNISDHWGWGRTKVRTFFNLLEEEGMIRREVFKKNCTKIKICNFETYQNVEVQEDISLKEHQKVFDKKEAKICVSEIENPHNFKEKQLVELIRIKGKEAYLEALNVAENYPNPIRNYFSFIRFAILNPWQMAGVKKRKEEKNNVYPLPNQKKYNPFFDYPQRDWDFEEMERLNAEYLDKHVKKIEAKNKNKREEA